MNSIVVSGRTGIATVAKTIAAGGIAAIPTETVYGLGADATNATAVARIYQAKGRPGDNPLILHIAEVDAFWALADCVPDYAQALMDAFWPGPLTLVVKKKPGLPGWLGGHPSRTAATVGVRMPSHPMALAVIRESGCYVAAPSANKAGTPSPTCAEHVAHDFADGSIDYVLDGGAVDCGLESTVVDVTGPEPLILRPGAITAEMVADVTGLTARIYADGTKAISQMADSNSALAEAPRAPGMKYRHYAPKAPMTLLVGEEEKIAAYVMGEVDKGRKTGILLTARTMSRLGDTGTAEKLVLGDKSMPESIARNLYACLRQFDILGVDVIFAESAPEEGLGVAIMDRMKKAAEGRVVYVT